MRPLRAERYRWGTTPARPKYAFVALGATLVWTLVGAGAAWAVAAQPYFQALPAAGSSEMHAAREVAVAAPLPDGQVLIAGGYDGTAGVMRSAELFSPSTDTFSLLPEASEHELATEREGAVAAPLQNGDVLIAGGLNHSYLRSAELFDPAADTFTALPESSEHELRTARGFATAAPLQNGDVLIAGGYAGGNNYLQSAELFDPVTDTFTLLEGSERSLHGGRDLAVAAPLPDGDVLIAGGYNGHSAPRSAELFDPASDTFSLLAGGGEGEPQRARIGAVAAPLADGQVLIAGGYNESALQAAELFDSAGGVFTALDAAGESELQTPREAAVGAPLPDGAVLIAGGSNGEERYLRTAELFYSPPQAEVAGGEFGSQTVGVTSGSQVLVLTNVGAQPLTVTAASLQGADAGDFAITADECMQRSVAFEHSCTITVDFTPAATGQMTASVVLSDNEPIPTTVALSGVGAPAAGPVTTVTTVTSGPTTQVVLDDATIVAPPNTGVHQLELLSCTSTTVLAGHTTTTTQTCSIKSTGARAKLAITPTAIAAKIARGKTVYATGSVIDSGSQTYLLVTVGRQLGKGSYTLTLTHGRTHHTEKLTIQ
jgi:hypothetical protein